MKFKSNLNSRVIPLGADLDRLNNPFHPEYFVELGAELDFLIPIRNLGIAYHELKSANHNAFRPLCSGSSRSCENSAITKMYPKLFAIQFVISPSNNQRH